MRNASPADAGHSLRMRRLGHADTKLTSITPTAPNKSQVCCTGVSDRDGYAQVALLGRARRPGFSAVEFSGGRAKSQSGCALLVCSRRGSAHLSVALVVDVADVEGLRVAQVVSVARRAVHPGRRPRQLVVHRAAAQTP